MKQKAGYLERSINWQTSRKTEKKTLLKVTE